MRRTPRWHAGPIPWAANLSHAKAEPLLCVIGEVVKQPRMVKALGGLKPDEGPPA